MPINVNRGAGGHGNVTGVNSSVESQEGARNTNESRGTTGSTGNKGIQKNANPPTGAWTRRIPGPGVRAGVGPVVASAVSRLLMTSSSRLLATDGGKGSLLIGPRSSTAKQGSAGNGGSVKKSVPMGPDGRPVLPPKPPVGKQKSVPSGTKPALPPKPSFVAEKFGGNGGKAQDKGAAGSPPPPIVKLADELRARIDEARQSSSSGSSSTGRLDTKRAAAALSKLVDGEKGTGHSESRILAMYNEKVQAQGLDPKFMMTAPVQDSSKDGGPQQGQDTSKAAGNMPPPPPPLPPSGKQSGMAPPPPPPLPSTEARIPKGGGKNSGSGMSELEAAVAKRKASSEEGSLESVGKADPGKKKEDAKSSSSKGGWGKSGGDDNAMMAELRSRVLKRRTSINGEDDTKSSSSNKDSSPAPGKIKLRSSEEVPPPPPPPSGGAPKAPGGGTPPPPDMSKVMAELRQRVGKIDSDDE